MHSSSVESESCYGGGGCIQTAYWVLCLVGVVSLMSVYVGVYWVLGKGVRLFLVFLVLCVW